MKLYRIFITVILIAVLHALDCPNLQAQHSLGLYSGGWEFTETLANGAKDQSTVWDFEIVDDGSPAIIALGERREDDKLVSSKGLAVVVIQRPGKGQISGYFIEPNESGQQNLFLMEFSVYGSGSKITMSTLNSDGQTHSTFVGKYAKAVDRRAFKGGEWNLCEIIATHRGDHHVQWNCDLNESSGKISGDGHIETVGTRRASIREIQTICNVSLNRQSSSIPNSLKGTGTIRTPDGQAIYTNYRGWVSRGGDKIALFNYKDGDLSTIIIGQSYNLLKEL